MNTKQFNSTEFKKGMQVIIDGKKVHNLIGVDFELMLIGINIDDGLQLNWVDAWKCEVIQDGGIR